MWFLVHITLYTMNAKTKHLKRVNAKLYIGELKGGNLV